MPPRERVTPAAPHAPVAASALSRVAGGAIDFVLIGTIDVARHLLHAAHLRPDVRATSLTLPVAPLVSFFLLLNGGYLAAFVAAGGQTIGKMAVGTRVIPAAPDGTCTERVSFGQAVVRAAGYLVSALPAGLGFVPALFGRASRASRSPRRYARRQSVTRLAVFLATVAYCGYFPIAPGTVGSAAGLVVYLLVWWTHSPIVEVALIAAIFAAGTWAATHAERFFGGIDPGPGRHR